LAVALALAVPLATSGCLGHGGRPQADADGWPPGWREETPAVSRLADVDAYDLVHSTSFLLKGHSYGRFVVRVPALLENVQVFFSTAAHPDGEGPTPTIDDPDAYHFEFLQIRPLGHHVATADVDAVTHFRHAEDAGVYTLTYLYGKGANYQMLAPYQGQADRWRFEPGYYDFVVATDEKLTVGINVRTGSPYWSTHYHPQELGTAHAEALGFTGTMRDVVGGRLPDDERDLKGIVRAEAGEFLNYFTFADVWYETKGLALGTTASSTVTVDGDPVPHRLALNSPEPDAAEAYAFAMDFNRPGPARVDLVSELQFHEEASARSRVVLMVFMFAVVLMPEEALDGLPVASDLPPA
jgi:hypothetical protein